MEGKLQVTFRQTLLNPCHTRLHGLSNRYHATHVGETQEKRENIDLWRNHEKWRKTEKNGDILRYEILQKGPKVAPLLDLSPFLHNARIPDFARKSP